MSTTLAFNAGTPAVYKGSDLNLLAAVGGKPVYSVKGQNQPYTDAAPQIRSGTLATDGNWLSTSWATGLGVHFAASRKPGVWETPDVLVAPGDGEQPTIAITPEAVTIGYHSDGDGHAKLATIAGEEAVWSLVDLGPGKFVSVAGIDRVAFRSDRTTTGTWVLYVARRKTDGSWVVTSTGVVGMDPSIVQDAGGSLVYLAWQKNRVISAGRWDPLTATFATQIRVTPVGQAGLFPRILRRDDGTLVVTYEDLTGASSSTDNANKTVGIAVSFDGGLTWKAKGDGIKGRSYATGAFAPDGTFTSIWVNTDGSIGSRSVTL